MELETFVSLSAIVSVISSGILAFMAIVAGIFSWIEIHSHKEKENNKLLSQLNKRYLENEDIQMVVRYLREIDADPKMPRPYQTELFLRFFEELGLYMKNYNLPKNAVKNFFEFYLKRMYTTERGKELLVNINYDERKWIFLNIYKKNTDFEY